VNRLANQIDAVTISPQLCCLHSGKAEAFPERGLCSPLPQLLPTWATMTFKQVDQVSGEMSNQ
jgi:hypothetical protein